MSLSAVTDKLKQYPLAVICVGFLVVFVALIFVRGGVADELSIQEADLNARIRTIKENAKNSIDIQKEVDDLGLIVDGIEQRLFDRDRLGANTNFFYAIEQRIGVSNYVATQLPDPDAIYAKGGPRALNLHSTLVFDISFSGTFEDILRFYYELHRIDPMVRIADFQVSGSARSAQMGILDSRIRVLVMARNE